MKKLSIAACLLAVVASTAVAGTTWLFGGGAGYTGQDTSGGHPWNATSLGVMEQSWFDLGETLGIYTAATIGFMAGARDNGAALDIGKYQSLGLNVLLGIGYKVSITPWLTALGGAGLYLGSTTLAASNQTLSSYYAGGFGAGLGVSLLYSLSLNWGIGLTINAAYTFANPGDTLPTMSPFGLNLFGGIGVTYFASPVFQAPTFSRFAAATTRR